MVRGLVLLALAACAHAPVPRPEANGTRPSRAHQLAILLELRASWGGFPRVEGLAALQAQAEEAFQLRDHVAPAARAELDHALVAYQLYYASVPPSSPRFAAVRMLEAIGAAAPAQIAHALLDHPAASALEAQLASDASPALRAQVVAAIGVELAHEISPEHRARQLADETARLADRGLAAAVVEGAATAQVTAEMQDLLFALEALHDPALVPRLTALAGSWSLPEPMLALARGLLLRSVPPETVLWTLLDGAPADPRGARARRAIGEALIARASDRALPAVLGRLLGRGADYLDVEAWAHALGGLPTFARSRLRPAPVIWGLIQDRRAVMRALGLIVWAADRHRDHEPEVRALFTDHALTGPDWPQPDVGAVARWAIAYQPPVDCGDCY